MNIKIKNPLSFGKLRTSPLTGRLNLGFTLVELLIVITIIIVMAVMLVGIFNAIGLTNKARDARRKKDLNRIKISFEEYFNDKGSYPSYDLLQKLKDKNNCGKNIDDFPYLKPWPCDPNGVPYKVMVGVNKFTATTYLENKEDKDIPSYPTIVDANYGVSSSNILWYDGSIYDDGCILSECHEYKYVGSPVYWSCSDARVSGCIGDNCFLKDRFGRTCDGDCKVRCCGLLCNSLQN